MTPESADPSPVLLLASLLPVSVVAVWELVTLLVLVLDSKNASMPVDDTVLVELKPVMVFTAQNAAEAFCTATNEKNKTALIAINAKNAVLLIFITYFFDPPWVISRPKC